jgi:hypothetical protein
MTMLGRRRQRKVLRDDHSLLEISCPVDYSEQAPGLPVLGCLPTSQRWILTLDTKYTSVDLRADRVDTQQEWRVYAEWLFVRL